MALMAEQEQVREQMGLNQSEQSQMPQQEFAGGGRSKYGNEGNPEKDIKDLKTYSIYDTPHYTEGFISPDNSNFIQRSYDQVLSSLPNFELFNTIGSGINKLSDAYNTQLNEWFPNRIETGPVIGGTAPIPGNIKGAYPAAASYLDDASKFSRDVSGISKTYAPYSVRPGINVFEKPTYVPVKSTKVGKKTIGLQKKS